MSSFGKRRNRFGGGRSLVVVYRRQMPLVRPQSRLPDTVQRRATTATGHKPRPCGLPAPKASDRRDRFYHMLTRHDDRIGDGIVRHSNNGNVRTRQIRTPRARRRKPTT